VQVINIERTLLMKLVMRLYVVT